MTVLNADALNEILQNAGLSRTVYAFVMPETQRAIDDILGDQGSAKRAALHEMYTEAWTQKQDVYHQEFFATWRNWVPGVVAIGDQFAYEYPTAGASEPIREAIYTYAMRARLEGFDPKIHVFAGEYEGYAAYADAAGVPLVVHDRQHWQDSLSSVEPHHQVYVSHPSAIDGNIWPEYDAFMTALLERCPGTAVMLDLTYVGCVARTYRIRADYPNIEQIFFSLSKPFGLYYHRCGGVISRSESKGLFGNKWFKNLLSLKIGTEMMARYDVHALPEKYRVTQVHAAEAAAVTLGTPVDPCDIFVLGKSAMPAEPSPLHQYLRRSPTHDFYRICLTPTIAHLTNSKVSSAVHVRAHETLDVSK